MLIYNRITPKMSDFMAELLFFKSIFVLSNFSLLDYPPVLGFIKIYWLQYKKRGF